jgi:hypothetical protein
MREISSEFPGCCMIVGWSFWCNPQALLAMPRECWGLSSLLGWTSLASSFRGLVCLFGVGRERRFNSPMRPFL